MIILSDVSLRYPLLSLHTHSLQSAVFGKVGGLIKKTKREPAYVEALNNISLHIPDHSRVGVVGHNGAGKTTLLRVICGVYPPTTGSIITQGKISAMTDIALGMDPNANGLKNILLRLVFMGYTFSQAQEVVDPIVEFSELGDFIHMPVYTYSTGMYMRLAFAIATHFPPDILILDEIIGAGDEGFREKAITRIQTLLESARIVILSSHDLGAIKKYCDRAILLKKGSLISEGNTDSILEQYQVSKKEGTEDDERT